MTVEQLQQALTAYVTAAKLQGKLEPERDKVLICVDEHASAFFEIDGVAGTCLSTVEKPAQFTTRWVECPSKSSNPTHAKVKSFRQEKIQTAPAFFKQVPVFQINTNLATDRVV